MLDFESIKVLIILDQKKPFDLAHLMLCPEALYILID
jgi:hypothetical protein